MKKLGFIKLIFLILAISILVLDDGYTQFISNKIKEADQQESLKVDGDIFSDFNEEIEASQVFEDERFYRYGRFFSFNIGVGVTSYLGNRGLAYYDQHPTISLAVYYFQDFNKSFGFGFEYSKHSMSFTGPTEAYTSAVSLIEINMFRTFYAFKYYLDTADLGTAITYSNPFFIARIEYWNQTNKFIDQSTQPNLSGGGFGFAQVSGLEFPVTLKESYIGVEILYHEVNFFDTYTQDYREVIEVLKASRT